MSAPEGVAAVLAALSCALLGAALLFDAVTSALDGQIDGQEQLLRGWGALPGLLLIGMTGMLLVIPEQVWPLPGWAVLVAGVALAGAGLVPRERLLLLAGAGLVVVGLASGWVAVLGWSMSCIGLLGRIGAALRGPRQPEGQL